jgi:uncharacterized protein
MRPIKSGPLTNQEIEELDAFLLSDDDLENAMDVSSLDGFLCAALSGPNVIMPSEWMRWVWDNKEGKQSPKFTSEKQAQRILGLLMAHANGIAVTLTQFPQYYEPLFLERGHQRTYCVDCRRVVLRLRQRHRTRPAGLATAR